MNRAEFEKVVYRVLLDLAEHNETRTTALEKIMEKADEWVEDAERIALAEADHD